MLAVVCTMATVSFAQTEKGSFVLAGSTGLQFSSGTTKTNYYGNEGEYKASTFSFTPTFAYFVVDDLAIGLSSTFTSMEKSENEFEMSASSLTVLPTVLYYLPLEGKLRPFVQAGIGWSSTSSDYTNGSNSSEESSASGLAFNFGGGIAYFIRENISIDLGLLYSSVKLTDSDNKSIIEKQGNLGFNIGLSVYF